MEAFTQFVLSVKDVGVPILFFLLVLYLIFKCYPDWQKSQAEKQKREDERRDKEAATLQTYYDSRNKSYEEQMSTIIEVARQGNTMIGQATQVIQQSTEVIRMNTEVIKASNEAHKEVREALGRDLRVLQTLQADLKVHDHRVEKVYVDIEKILDRTD